MLPIESMVDIAGSENVITFSPDPLSPPFSSSLFFLKKKTTKQTNETRYCLLPSHCLLPSTLLRDETMYEINAYRSCSFAYTALPARPPPYFFLALLERAMSWLYWRMCDRSFICAEERKHSRFAAPRKLSPIEQWALRRLGLMWYVKKIFMYIIYTYIV